MAQKTTANGVAWPLGARWIVALVAVIVLASACGDDSSSDAGSDDTTDDQTSDDAGDASGDETSEMVNACPEDGCTITITDVAEQDGELAITWDANYSPDVARNHVHVYWDTFTADQVSGDADARGVVQGVWVPTDMNPTYVTEGAVSVTTREDSTTVCVTAADRDHVVLDAELVDCRDVSDVLPS